MNYIEFELGGKLRGFKFGLGTLGDVMLHYNVDLLGLLLLLNKNVYSVTPVMLFYAHKFDQTRKGKPATLELWQFSEWLDEMQNPMDDENIASAMTILVESITKYLPKNEEDTEKSGEEKGEEKKK